MAKSRYQVELEDFKRELVVQLREHFQPTYDLCEDGIQDFLDFFGLQKYDPDRSQTFSVSFKIEGRKVSTEEVREALLAIEGHLDSFMSIQSLIKS